MADVRAYWLGYLFVTFAVGVACLGVAVFLAFRKRKPVSRAFLAFYAALSLMVTASLLLAYADSAPGELLASARPFLQYLESIVGLYGIMLTFPLFTHRVFGVANPFREKVLVVIVLATLGLQHVTEYALASTPWDQRGDRFEDGVLLVLMVYSFWIAYSRRGSADAERPLASRVFALLVFGIPGMLYDLFFSESSGLFLYPLWYCVTSVVVTWTLVQSESKSEAPSPKVSDQWGLSQRELEIANGVARGLSNKEIAAALHISPNTVKTHLRSIFEKASVRSRFELISQMSGFLSGNHPTHPKE
ncbi:MAG: hypothetical protein DWQ01_02440 [Planctomycetota bacterium]|nr:MAG: hypothetical protein DWQ01_02440 [Planctomycetota bacterium]